MPPAIGSPSSSGATPDTAWSGSAARTGTAGNAPSLTVAALTVVPLPRANPGPIR